MQTDSILTCPIAGQDKWSTIPTLWSTITTTKKFIRNKLGKIMYYYCRIKTNILETPQNPRKENILQSLSFKAAVGILLKRQLLTRLDANYPETFACSIIHQSKITY